MSEEGQPIPQDTDQIGGNSPIKVLGQYIKDLSFEVPGAPQIFTVLGQTPVNLSMSVIIKTNHVGNSSYEVVLQFHIGATAAEQTAFMIELHYGCVVDLDETVIPQQQIHPVLNIEVPRLLYPFARQIISDMCSSSGFPPLLLQIIDFGELYVQRYGVNAQPPTGQDEKPYTLN